MDTTPLPLSRGGNSSPIMVKLGRDVPCHYNVNTSLMRLILGSQTAPTCPHDHPRVDQLLGHSSSLVAIVLSLGYETWPPSGWHHTFVIVWSKYRLGLPSATLHYGFTWPVGIQTIFQTPVTVPLLVGAVQGDCTCKSLWVACKPGTIHIVPLSGTYSWVFPWGVSPDTT